MGTWWQHPALASCRSSKHPPALGIAPFVGHRARRLGICLVVLGGCWGGHTSPSGLEEEENGARGAGPSWQPLHDPISLARHHWVMG